MRHNPFFKLLCTIILSFYGIAVAQAGQVITKDNRQWAKQALAQESYLGTIESANSVAVLNFHNKTSQNLLNGLQKGMALMLITDLSKIDSLLVIERIRIQALVDEMKFGETGLVDPQSAPKVGKFLKAYYVVNGDILEDAIDEIKLGSSVLDVPFENISDLPGVLGNLDELFRMEKDILFNIIGKLKIKISPDQKVALMAPLSLSTAALLALFIGIDYSDKGQYNEAAKMYNRAISEDPGIQIAQDSLQELKDMGLISNKGISRVEPESGIPPSEEDGTGMGTVVGVGLALAAIGGGALLLSSSSDDNDETTQENTQQTPTPSSPVTISPTSVESSECASDLINFTFSEPMNTGYGEVTTTPPLSTVDYYFSSDGVTLTFTWSGASVDLDCGGDPEPFAIHFKDFISTDNQSMMDIDVTVTTY